MSLRYAILGYLSSGPGTGYDLARQLDTGLGWFWTARHSQIYPELKKLTEGGLIRRHSAVAGENFDKFEYSITEAGLAELREWAGQAPSYPPNRDSERLQLIFSDEQPSSLRLHLEAHLEHFRQRRDRLRETLSSMQQGTHPRVQKRIDEGPPSRADLTLKLRELAYSGDIARAELEVAWAQSALDWLDEYEQDNVERLAGRQPG
ncbi:PadR family transcriptional regulator [Amycolatopsis mongoliensis]|uniref:PadR family transcriptional regulator n=1 Tax=Amycolatopsis mongoliensis TaxID=715475 RepID=A0A9Y2JM89_9PSEU|nr:PadR family transcriptional regulator [Amycolatopsis sp. 4-36]WIY01093.1 PadR family transcriptional regulator [Amycolatopsis sp. 4-36]